MELTQAKNAPYSGFNKTMGSIVVPFFGVATLFIVALQFWRAADGFQRFGLVPVALGVITIGLWYYRHRRALNELEGKVDDEVLTRLHDAGNAMAAFGYLACEMALIFSVHRH